MEKVAGAAGVVVEVVVACPELVEVVEESVVVVVEVVVVAVVVEVVTVELEPVPPVEESADTLPERALAKLAKMLPQSPDAVFVSPSATVKQYGLPVVSS